MTLSVRSRVEKWPITGSFVISRGSRTEVSVVVAEISDGIHTGRGECVPYARYGETIESVVSAIESSDVSGGRDKLRRASPPGAARNALDCALWDLEAKQAGKPAWALAGLKRPQPVVSCYTLSLGTPEEMARAAGRAADMPILKIKLGGDGDAERIFAVRDAAPRAELVADANEAWNEENFAANLHACEKAGVTLIEQPLPADRDALLGEIVRTVPVCADESVHVAADLDRLVDRYDGVNVKLDKAGGLTEALRLVREARRRDFRVMVGCMLATSLAMAPAMLIAQEADIVDLDGPLLLARDREPGLFYSGALVSPPEPALWG